MIRITAKRDGFRRCGAAHSAAPTDWATGYWSPEQLAVLQEEPMLVVEMIAEQLLMPESLGQPQRRKK